ncbi:hypothetical protein KIPB_008989 [Kipferlia bialata]|uniref:Uncharacterized protein n=1 Tax=Kipferlia bialata TaxID=797122 RepID=A0A9K3GKA1_9EUKA|nr:hypothetical protein KIPB_008989 [Kipferlia bialata]|eukprot:g8989.t1
MEWDICCYISKTLFLPSHPDDRLREILRSEGVLPLIRRVWVRHSGHPDIVCCLMDCLARLCISDTCRREIVQQFRPLMVAALSEHHTHLYFPQCFLSLHVLIADELSYGGDHETACAFLSDILAILSPLATDPASRQTFMMCTVLKSSVHRFAEYSEVTCKYNGPAILVRDVRFRIANEEFKERVSLSILHRLADTVSIPETDVATRAALVRAGAVETALQAIGAYANESQHVTDAFGVLCGIAYCKSQVEKLVSVGVHREAVRALSTYSQDVSVLMCVSHLLAFIADAVDCESYLPDPLTAEVFGVIATKESLAAICNVMRIHVKDYNVVYPLMQVVDRLASREEHRSILVESAVMPHVAFLDSDCQDDTDDIQQLYMSIKSKLGDGLRASNGEHRLISDADEIHPLTSGTMEHLVGRQIGLGFGQRLGNAKKKYGTVCMPPNVRNVLYMPDQGPKPLAEFCDALRSMSLVVTDMGAAKSMSALKRDLAGVKTQIVVCSYAAITARPGTKLHKLHTGMWREIVRDHASGTGTGVFMCLDERAVETDESGSRALYTKMATMVNAAYSKTLSQKEMKAVIRVQCIPFDRYFQEVWGSPLYRWHELGTLAPPHKDTCGGRAKVIEYGLACGVSSLTSSYMEDSCV